MIGRTLARYHITGRIGAGGMGVVYRARDLRLERDVAVKVLPEGSLDDERARRRFHREALALSRVNHPNIETIHDFDTQEGLDFLVTELVVGSTLSERLERRPLAEPEAIGFALQIADALGAAHARGLVHRDLKPSNIMVTEEGRVKLLDFGVARLLYPGHTSLSSTATEHPHVTGTLPYMAPEPILGVEPDHRADLYSLGVVLYEMVAGRPPFLPEVPAALLYQIVHQPPPSPRSFNPDVSAGLETVILRCLEKDPDRRYASAAELVRDLEQAVGKADSASPVTGAGQVREPRRGRTRVLLGAGILVTAVATAGALSWWGAGHLQGARSQRAPNRVVVAVFENVTGDRALDPVGRMAADWISQGLARTGLVDVVPTVTVLQSAGGAQRRGGADERLAEETGAATVVSGAYYRQDDGLAFQARLTDTAHGRLIQALDPVPAPVTSPLQGIEALRQRVMAALATHLNPSLSTWASVASRPPTLAAYEEYIGGAECFARREWQEAIGHFARAAAFDSTYTYPALVAAIAYLNLGEPARIDSIVRVVNRSRDRLAPLDRLVLDWLEAGLRGDLARAYRVASDAAAMAPGSMWPYQRGLHALLVNRPGESIAALSGIAPGRGAMRGWSPYWETLASAHHMRGDFRRELAEARRGRRQYPQLLSMLGNEVRALAALGDLRAVEARLDESLSLPSEPGRSPGVMMMLATRELQAHGHRDAAGKVSGRAVVWYASRMADPNAAEEDSAGLAGALYLAGRWQEARALFERLAAAHDDNLHYHGYLGVLAARQGDNAAARRQMDLLGRMDGPYVRGSNAYWQADIAALLGERARAVALLRRAFELGHPIAFQMHSDPDLEPLRGDPAFRELLRPKG